MRTPTTAGALRVARTLLGYSQRVAATHAGLLQKSIVQVEDPASERFDINISLVSFYRARGVEFLGETMFGERIRRSGARLKLPDHFPELIGNQSPEQFPARYNGTSLMAARSLLGLHRTDVADAVGISRNTIAALEKGGGWTDAHETLRGFYDSQEIEFLGWGEIGSKNYFGVGVRWKCFERDGRAERAAAR